MSELKLSISEQLATDIKARIKALDFTALQKSRKGKEDNGTFDVIISTEDVDRSGEIVKQSGWELQNYKNNPIVLWGHDYYSLPIGVCTETYLTEKNGIPALGARGVFLSAEINPFAQQVRKLYEFGIGKGEGVGCTTSVGFIPKEFDENARNTITKAELLEFSFVPIPANQGVGPAEGRALTFQEARELKLDTAMLVKKGIPVIEAESKTEEKEAQAGDACTTDDGSAGVLAGDPKDPEGPLVCIPEDGEKSQKANEVAKTSLMAAVDAEHERHSEEVAKCFEAFQRSVEQDANDEEAGEDEAKKAKRLSDKARAMRENLKDLRSSISDEHTMHRAKSIAAFRGFNPAEGKAFDKNEHLKALRDEHDAYEAKCGKSLDTFEEKCMKSIQGAPGTTDEHTDWITGKMEGHQGVHQKAVTKIAKGMCKEAFAEGDEADEKTLEILKEFLAPHIDAQLLPIVVGKIGSKITTEQNKKLGEAHQHMKAAIAVVEALNSGLKNSDGEESRSDTGVAPVATAPEKKRSRPKEAPANDEINEFMFGRELAKEIVSVAQRGLEHYNKRAKH